MKYKENKPHRLKYFNYSKPGYYFVTICTKNRIEWFGEIKNDEMFLNENGNIASMIWTQIPEHYKNILIDEWIIMPNHIHGIIIIKRNARVDVEHCSTSTGQNNYGLLSKVIKSFKEFTIKTIRTKHFNYDFKWQRSFHDHIIKNEYALNNIRKYIRNNPSNWSLDIKNKSTLCTRKPTSYQMH